MSHSRSSSQNTPNIKDQLTPITPLFASFSKTALGISPSLMKVITILNTSPTSRSSNFLKTLVTITQDVPFFIRIRNEINESAHRSCCQYMHYLFKNKNDVVFNVGDQGDLFYVILNGTVKVLVPTVISEEETQLMQVSTLEAGCSFGELALLKSQPRAATIICDTNTHFAILEKHDYLRILGENSTTKLDDLIEFLGSLPVFSKWAKRELVKLSYYFTPISFKRNQVIYRENDSPKDVYIITKGEVELYRKVSIELPIMDTKSNQYGRPKFIKKKSKFQQARLAIKSKGEFVGHEEIIKGTNRLTSCKCYSETVEMLSISKLEFKRRIRSEDALNQFMDYNKIKELHREKIVKDLKDIQSNSTLLLSIRKNNQPSLSEDDDVKPTVHRSNCFLKPFKSSTATIYYENTEDGSYMISPKPASSFLRRKSSLNSLMSDQLSKFEDNLQISRQETRHRFSSFDLSGYSYAKALSPNSSLQGFIHFDKPQKTEKIKASKPPEEMSAIKAKLLRCNILGPSRRSFSNSLFSPKT
ncbi:unnamed protein product [Blepharisma stoltei]|uniref:Cyclic nucleotide-binding domain-containing protein n=1 Tax=Blepharisma stoltei TaxID=1481888 RepID=A0AAU9K0Z7_9CILI|nr:unnamed protein product [Blepharisma stoltei]